MSKKIRTRVIIILFVTLASLYLVFLPHDRRPTLRDFTSWAQVKDTLRNNIKLGLDLRGGSHLVMQVQTDDVIKGIATKNAEAARGKLTEKGWAFTEVANGVDTVSVTLPDTTK